MTQEVEFLGQENISASLYMRQAKNDAKANTAGVKFEHRWKMCIFTLETKITTIDDNEI